MSEDSDKLKLRRNGDLTITVDGHKTIVAHYNKDSGLLEFETKKYSVDYYTQATACIGTVGDGKEVSGNVIRSITVKGEDRPDAKHLPKKPKMGPLGDATEEVVRWYLDNDMAQAIIRYGIYTDEKGQPVRRNVKRVMQTTVDQRFDTEDNDIEAVKDGRSSVTKAPVRREGELIEDKNQIIARRATPLTFTPQEVVGGFTPEDDDFAPASVSGEEGEE